MRHPSGGSAARARARAGITAGEGGDSLRGFLGVFRYNAGNRGFSYLNFSSVYDVLLEIGLAFGMVLLAAERVRVELEERNRKLAEAGEELAKAARTRG